MVIIPNPSAAITNMGRTTEVWPDDDRLTRAKLAPNLSQTRAKVRPNPRAYHRITIRYPYDNRRITPRFFIKCACTI